MTLEQLVVIIKAETAQLEKGIDRIKSQLSSLDKASERISNRMTNSFNKSSSGIGKALKALSLGAVVAGLYKFGKSAIDAASDLQEWGNVVEVAFGDASGAIDNFTKQAVKQFGLSALQTKQLTGNFKAMADGIGLSQKAGAKMAIQLTGLSADMASFFNTTTESTSNALQGIFTGQTRALKQFGVVMSEANLEAFRLERGITTAYSKMNEAQRVALRYNYVLASTANAQNDFARTSMSWANQMRLLAMNWNQLITTVGNGLMKILAPVVAILNKILSAAVSVVNAIAKIFGGEGIASVGTKGGGGSGLGDLSDDAGNLGKNLGGANKKAKELKATIAGFDELEVLNSQPSSGGSGGGGSGAGGGSGGAGAEDLDSYFDLYNEEGVLNKFEDFFQKIKDMMDADNWEGIGAEIGKGLNKVFQVVDDWITGTFEPFGVLWSGRIARVLNGLVDAVDWDLVGKTFADGLNAYIHIANEFYEKFNALNFAVGIATAINSWFRNVDWEGIGAYLANKLNFLGDILYGFATTIDWEQIKNSINTALSSLFEKLDVQKIKESITKLVNDAMDFLRSVDWYKIGHTVGEMLSGVDWIGVLKTVKDTVIWPAWKGFWDGLMSDGKNHILGWIGKIGSWFKDSFWGPFAAAVLSLAGTNIMLGALRGFFTGGDKKSFYGAILDSMTWVITSLGGLVPQWGKEITGLFSSVRTIIGENLDQIGADIKSGGLFSTLKTVFSTIGDSMFDKGISLGGSISAMAGLTTVILSLTSAYGGLGGVLERVKQMFSDMFDVAKKVLEALGAQAGIDILKDAFSRLGDALKRVYDALGTLKPMWELLFDTISTVGGAVLGVLGTIGSAMLAFVGVIIDGVAMVINAITTPIAEVLKGVGAFCQAIVDFFAWLKYQLIGDPIVIDMWNGIKKIFKESIGKVIDFVKGLVNKVVEFFTNLYNKAKTIFTNIKTFLSNTWSAIKTTAVNTWNGIKTTLTTVWDNLKTKVSTTWNNLKSTISGAWGSIKEKTANTWSSITSTIGSKWDSIKTKVANAVNSLKSNLTDKWKAVKDNASNTWNSIKSSVGSVWDGMKSKSKSIADGIASAFKTSYKSITDKWGGLKKFFSGVWDGLVGIVKSAMNSVIRVLNKFSIEIPDWVPKFGGRKFGFNIPYLAEGGVITSPTLAMVGEYAGAKRNPEIVAPQSMIREIISEENGEMVSALYQIAKQIISAIDDVDLSVSIGDDQIGNAANRANNAYKKRTGRPLFSM